ncbi:hypothetical protein Hanom_Chr08g00743211 [Helianthus anomalus]
MAEYSGDNRRTIPEAVEVNTVSDDGEIEATREKLMLDFQMEVGMKDAILRGNGSGFRRR